VEEKADAVLIRAIEPIEGIETMYERRGKKLNNYHLSGGPGKVCQCLGIDKDVNGLPFFSKESPIQLFDSGLLTTEIVSTPRVGMSKNVADYANTPWRFYIKDNPFVSKPLQLSYNYG
jgi:DNA-3-methyladenine glycosylase